MAWRLLRPMWHMVCYARARGQHPSNSTSLTRATPVGNGRRRPKATAARLQTFAFNARWHCRAMGRKPTLTRRTRAGDAHYPMLSAIHTYVDNVLCHCRRMGYDMHYPIIHVILAGRDRCNPNGNKASSTHTTHTHTSTAGAST